MKIVKLEFKNDQIECTEFDLVLQNPKTTKIRKCNIGLKTTYTIDANLLVDRKYVHKIKGCYPVLYGIVENDDDLQMLYVFFQSEFICHNKMLMDKLEDELIGCQTSFENIFKQINNA